MSDRKYGQRGYQDSDRSERERRPPQQQGPRERPEGPRGRGLGRPTESVFRCAACGEKLLLTGLEGDTAEIAADSTCARCKADLHTCSNCVHFDTAARWECRQAISERVARKRERNACPLFQPRTVQEFAAESTRPAPGDARSAFDALFKI
jgi:hypothetical protein